MKNNQASNEIVLSFSPKKKNICEKHHTAPIIPKSLIFKMCALMVLHILQQSALEKCAQSTLEKLT